MNKTLKRLCAALLLAVPLTMSGCGVILSSRRKSVSPTP